MKTSTFRTVFLIVVICFSCIFANAQVIKTIGGSGANYATLKLAFDAINAGSVTGIITLQITGSTTETASASINASGIGNANYSSVTIYPTVSGCSITGNFNSQLINLNGANNITIDGRVNRAGSSANLMIVNSNTGNSAPTFRFVNSAANNDIKYCNIYGSTINTVTGIIILSSSTTGTGNSNNIIENCNITNAGGNRPINAILISGSTGHENSNNIIRNNNIYNFLNQANQSNGVTISSGSIGNVVSGNSFYETTNFAPTGTNSFHVINITTSENQTISSNYIGGSSPQCGGTAWIINGNFAHYWCGINATGGNSTPILIQNNQISNINDTSTEDNPWDGIYINAGNVDVIGNTIGSPTGNNSIIVNTPVAYATTTISNGVVTAINIIGGGSGYTVAPTISFSVNNGGTGVAAEAEITNGIVTKINILNGGSGYTSAPSVYFDGQSNMYSTSHGMIQNSSGTVNITNNNIGSITTYGTDTYSHGWESVYVRSVTGVTTFDGNLIGSLTTSNSIHTGSSSANSLIKLDVYGIYSSGIGTTIIKNNTVANLTNNYSGTNSGSRTRGIQTIAGANTIQDNIVKNITSYSAQNATRTSASVVGISQTSSTAGTNQIVADNFVSNIVSANSSAKVDVYGIFYVGPTTGSNYVSDNFVHSIFATSTNTTCEVDGIVLNWGLTTCYNNIVNLGSGITIGYKFNGIVDDSGTNNFNSIYFNSIYLGGTVSGTTSTTAALLNNANNTTRIYENNILYNARSGGTTGKHYAAILAGNSGVTVNYNDYFVSGTNSALMKYGSIDEISLIAIKSATGQDVNSLSIDPLYSISGGTNALNYYAAANLNGLAITGISNDYDDLARKSPPKMGALESNNYVWQGNISTDFGTAGNWVGGSVPPNGADIAFAATPNRNCVLDQNRTLEDITNAQSTYKFVVNGKQLTLTGSLIFSNGAQIDATTAYSTVTYAGLAAQSLVYGSYVNNSVDTLKINNVHGFSLNTDFTIQKGIALMAGNFAIGPNTLTFNGIVTATTGTVTGGTNTNMIIGGSGGIINMPDFTLNNLIINRASGVSLYGNLNIVGTLTLTNGILLLNANTLTISGNSPARTNGMIDASNLASNVVFANSSPISLPTSLFANSINNFSISGSGGITINSDITVNGELALQHANPSSLKGILDMGSNTLTMGANGITTGIGDVTGIVKRNSFVASTAYTFGNQHTTMTFSAGGTMPTDVSIKILMGTAPSWKTTAVQRYYDIKRTGGLNTNLTLDLHYLPSELQSNTETNLVIWDYHATIPRTEEHGKSNQDLTDNWIEISNRSVTYFDTTFGTHQWGISNKESANFVWQGTPSADWNDPNNWTGGIVPTSTSDVVIPDASTTFHSPTLNTTSNVKTIVIQPNGILNGGSSTTLTISGSTGAWFNLGTFNHGTSNVIFTNANATMADPTDFYDITIANGAALTLGTDNIMRISGTMTLQGTGILRAALLPNTVEFNGTNQTIFNANGLTQGYYNLILSGSGTKTMPDTELNIEGDLTISGTTTAVADSIINLNGNLIVDQGATFVLNDYDHIFSGNIVCNGTLNTSTNTGSVTLIGENVQSIDGINGTDIEFNSLIISNIKGVIVNKDVTITSYLTINSGSNITINPSYKVNVNGIINNNAGQSGLVIKSSPLSANGSLIFHNADNSPVSATVEMYSKANWNLDNEAGSKYQWQFFGIPLKSVNYNEVFANCYVRKWNETGRNDNENWNMLYTNSSLSSIAGYEIVQASSYTYIFKGQLNNGTFSKSLTKTSGAQFSGQHILGNPFTAAIDITKIDFGTNTEASVYLYNTGSYNDWLLTGSKSIPGNNPGQYTVSTKNTAGYGGIPGQIPSMQGFLVKALNSSASITIPYSSISSNTEQQRIPSSKITSSTSKIFTRIELRGNQSSDFLWLFTDPTCNRTFDNGWDGYKVLGSVNSPQLYAIEPDGNYQIDAIADIDNTIIGFIPNQDYQYKLVFQHLNLENCYKNIFLVDNAENKVVDITENGSEYNFVNSPASSLTNRFKIVTKNETNTNVTSLLSVKQQSQSILLNNFSNEPGIMTIYNLAGLVVTEFKFEANSMKTIGVSGLNQGLYLIKAQTNSHKEIQKFIKN